MATKDEIIADLRRVVDLQAKTIERLEKRIVELPEAPVDVTEHRLITQGTRGDAGQRYHERMWTAIATCKKQNRNFFSFLHASIVAKLQNQAAPSLLT